MPPARILRSLVLGLALASASCGLVVGDAFDVRLRLDAGPETGIDGGAPTDGPKEQAPEAATETGSVADSSADSSDSSDAGDSSDSGSTIDSGDSGSLLPITLVQHSSVQSLGVAATTIVCSFQNGVTVGDMVIVAVQADQPIVSVSDEQNPMYPFAVSGGNMGSALAIYYFVPTAAGSQMVTVTFTSPAQAIVLIHEYSNLANQMPDQTQPFSGTGTNVQAGPVTTTSPRELLFAFGRSDVGLANVTPNGFKAGEYNGGDLTESRELTSVGQYSAPFTVSADAGGDWQALVVTFVGK